MCFSTQRHPVSRSPSCSLLSLPPRCFGLFIHRRTSSFPSERTHTHTLHELRASQTFMSLQTTRVTFFPSPTHARRSAPSRRWRVTVEPSEATRSQGRRRRLPRRAEDKRKTQRRFFTCCLLHVDEQPWQKRSRGGALQSSPRQACGATVQVLAFLILTRPTASRPAVWLKKKKSWLALRASRPHGAESKRGVQCMLRR